MHEAAGARVPFGRVENDALVRTFNAGNLKQPGFLETFRSIPDRISKNDLGWCSKNPQIHPVSQPRYSNCHAPLTRPDNITQGLSLHTITIQYLSTSLLRSSESCRTGPTFLAIRVSFGPSPRTCPPRSRKCARREITTGPLRDAKRSDALMQRIRGTILKAPEFDLLRSFPAFSHPPSVKILP
jgi:hypothetical protein